MTNDLTTILYLLSGVLFILAIRGLSSPDTARTGNYLGISGMAIERGGNCSLSKSGETVDVNGVSIVGDVSLINGISPDASNLFSKNLYAFLDILIDKETKDLVFDDEIIKDSAVTIKGQLSEKFTN